MKSDNPFGSTIPRSVVFLASVYSGVVSAISPEAQALHDDCIVIDLHADTLELVRVGLDLSREHRSMGWMGHVLGHVDLPRMQRGGLSGQFFGVVIPPWTRPGRAIERVRRQAELLRASCEKFTDSLSLATCADDVRKAHQQGKTAALIGVEGTYGLIGDEVAVAALTELGVAYVGPAHIFSSRDVPSNMTANERRLSTAAWSLIEELREAAILVDLAHLARGAFHEIAESSKGPVIVSHTGLAALKPMWRNIDDDQIRAVAETGGIVGIIFTARYLGRRGVEGIVDHLEHLVKVGGEDVAALGSDFDGLVRPPRDLADVAGLPLITQRLIERGMKETLVRKILGENALRVLATRSVEAG